jgi:type VI secretion system secreted protein Hcp
MPTPCNLKIAEYPGSSEKEGRAGTSDVFEVEHHLHQAIATATGAASGKREHSPLRVVKVIDKATPGLQKALCTGQRLKEVVLDFYRIDPATRNEKAYFHITLRNACIVDTRIYMPMSFVPQNESYRHMEEVCFAYESIEWKWDPDNVVTSDQWAAVPR